MGKYTLFPRPERMKLEEWSKSKCCIGGCYAIELISILIDGYRKYYRDNWSYCLTQKWSLSDCVAGCHNEEYDLDGLISQCRNGHQTQLRRIPISQAAKIIEDADKASDTENPDKKDEWFSDFEALYDDVRGLLKDVDGIHDLTIYDTALRIGWNKDPQLIPEKYVYLHRGAMEGALALQKISELTGKKYFTYKGKPGYRVELTYFREDLQALGANHLEDFLCVFHSILGYWAEGLERDEEKEKIKEEKKALKKEKKNNKNKKN